jgi:hypothetical protein
MISVRIEELPAEQILQMHEYYERLKRKEVEKGAKFSLLFSPLYNFLAGWLPMALAERGNCARYTSKGLEEGRIIKNASMWPKSLWVELFEEHGRNNPDNVHVVTYRQVRGPVHEPDVQRALRLAPPELKLTLPIWLVCRVVSCAL